MVKRSVIARSLGVAAVATLVLGPAASAAGASSASHPQASNAMQPPGTNGSFTNVSAVPHSTDVWAFGVDQTHGSANLVARRHHGSWQRESVDFGGKGTVSAIAAASSKTVWAAGVHGANRAWIGRWNGKKIVTVKLPGVKTGSFYAMSASSAKNAWAVGHVAAHNSTGFAAEHWDGKKWTAHAVPNLFLTSVSTTSSTNAWATATPGTLLHWNGKGWLENKTMPSNVTLTSVVAMAANKAIAVGYITHVKTGIEKAYITRFNGTKWVRIAARSPYHGDQLVSVTAHGSSVWAVGFGVNQAGTSRTLIEHSTGGKWRFQVSPIRGYSSFSGVSAASATHVYAVGSYRPSTDVHPITCFAAYNGHSWQAAAAKV